MLRMLAGAILAGILLAPGVGSAQGIADFTFSKIADTNTVVPEDTGTFAEVSR